MVHSLVAIDKDCNRYYDHNLTRISKEKLFDLIAKGQTVTADGFGTTPDTKSTTNQQRKDTALISILQINEPQSAEKSALQAANGANTATPTDGSALGTLRKRIGEKRKAQMKAGMLTKLTMMSEADIDRNIAEIERLGEQYKQAGKDGNPKLEKAAYQWLLNGVLRLPDDNYKILDALSVAEKLHIDPLAYESPMELMAQHSDTKPSLRKTDPDTIPQFSDKRELPEGVVTYEVEDTKEGQAAVRRMIDEHFGTDANPWCLAARNEYAWHYWHEVYTSYPKRIVFQNGKLIAFSANDSDVCYWDRNDKPHEGIPVAVKDTQKEGWFNVFEMNEEGEMTPSYKYCGNEKNGDYLATYWDGTLKLRCTYKNGTFDGEYESKYSNGNLCRQCTYKEGKLEGQLTIWNEDGSKREEGTFHNGLVEGLYTEWYNTGHSTKTYKRGELNGVTSYYNEKGELYREVAYEDGYPNGIEIEYDQGKVVERKYWYQGVRIN